MPRRRSLVLVIASFFACFFINLAPAYAEEEPTEPVEQGDPTLEITPVTKRMQLNAGETYTSTISVKNDGGKTATFRIYPAPFSSSKDGETQDFETQTNYTQVSRWITIKAADGTYGSIVSYTLAPHETREVEYAIKVPTEVPGGGQFAVIFVEATPDEGSKGGIQTISRAGMTIYATMPGEPKRSTHVKDIEVKSIILNGEIGIKTHVENDGNIDFQVATAINVYSLFGKQVYSNNNLASLFPETSKTIYLAWNNSPNFGIYRVEYSVDALDVHASGSQVILVLTPLTLILALIFIVTTIICIVYFIRRRHDNRKNAPTIVIG